MTHKYEDHKPPWLTFLEYDVLWLEGPGGLRVRGVSVKIQHSGLQAIIKIRRGEEHLVGFTGAKGLQSLSGKVRTKILAEDSVWKIDQWA